MKDAIEPKHPYRVERVEGEEKNGKRWCSLCGKWGYQTWSHAEADARAMQRKGRRLERVYHNPKCGRIHVGRHINRRELRKPDWEHDT